MKTALITGMNGFVGPYLKKELERANFLVYGLGKKELQNQEKYFVVDVTKRGQVLELVKKLSPQYIFHLAGVSSPFFAEKNEQLVREVNIGGTINILDAALFLEKKPRVLVVGSSFVYGSPQYLPIDEKHPLNGRGVYARVDIEREKIASDYETKLPLITTRSFNHTGPGQTDIFVIPKIVKQIVEIKKGRRNCLEMGNIDISRDFLDVKDVVRAYRQLLEQEKFGGVYNICRGLSISLKKVIEEIKILANLKEVNIKVNSNLLRTGESTNIYGDNSLIRKFLDWNIKYDYKTMLKDIYYFWEKNINNV